AASLASLPAGTELVVLGRNGLFVNGVKSTEAFESVIQSAAAREGRQVVVTNRLGYTGADYQGARNLIVADANPMSSTLMTQAEFRVGRANGNSFWAADRYFIADETAINSRLAYAADRVVADDYMRLVTKLEGASGETTQLFERYLANPSSLNL